MSYTLTSPLLGLGAASAGALTAWFRANAAGGLRWVQDHGYPAIPLREIPDDLGRIIVEECQRYAPAIANHDLVAADIGKEAAWLQSVLSRDPAVADGMPDEVRQFYKLNPSGLGAENDDPHGKAKRFTTLRAGIAATVAHWLNYAVGQGPWSASDPRVDALVERDWLGIAPRLVDLDGRWAWPGQGYGADIAARGNQLLAFMETWTGDPAVSRVPAPPIDERYSSPNRNAYGSEDGPRIVRLIGWHISQGTFASNIAWLTNPASDASCTWIIDRDGTIYELVPPEIAPWTQGQVRNPDLSNPIIADIVNRGWNPNQQSETIEYVGMSSYGKGGSLTAAQQHRGQWLTAWRIQERGLAPTREHVIGHYQIDSVNRPYCPGFSAAEWDTMLAGVRQWLAADEPNPTEPPAEPLDPNALRVTHIDYGDWWVVNVELDGRWVVMLDGWRELGELNGLGYPLGPMTQHADGVYRQPFENGIGEVWPDGWGGHPGPWFRVGGIPQNWAWFRPIVGRIAAKWKRKAA